MPSQIAQLQQQQKLNALLCCHSKMLHIAFKILQYFLADCFGFAIVKEEHIFHNHLNFDVN